MSEVPTEGWVNVDGAPSGMWVNTGGLPPLGAVPDLGVIQPRPLVRPLRQPIFDTEWLDFGMEEVTFFVSPIAFKSPQRNTGESGKQWGLHTNVISRCGLLAKGQEMRLERIVMYPTLEGVRGNHESYLASVDRFRAGARYSVVHGCDERWGGPLSDILACVIPPFHPAKGDFDPSEAPGLEYRRGLDMRVEGNPFVLTEREEFRIRVYGPHVRGEVGLRCYLVGTQLRSICQ